MTPAAFLAAALAIWAPHTRHTDACPHARRIAAAAPAVLSGASRSGEDPLLLAALIARESAWNPRAVSRRGAVGLMQIAPRVARAYGVPARRLVDPATNLAVGIWLLERLRRRCGDDLRLVLSAYNGRGCRRSRFADSVLRMMERGRPRVATNARGRTVDKE